jgi:hypothetical protein
MAQPHMTCSRENDALCSATAAALAHGVIRSVRDQPVDVVEADRKHDAVDQHEQHQRRGNRIRGEWRDRLGGSQQSIGNPGLPPSLGDDPAGDDRDEADPPGILCGPEIPSRLEQAAAPPQPHAGQSSQDH